MTKLYRRLFYYDEFIGGNLSLILIYGITAIVSFVGYKQGVIEIRGTTEVFFEAKNIYEAIISIFAFIYSLLIQALPVIFSIWLFSQYNKLFSSEVKVSSVIPVSNKYKMKKIIITALAINLAYLLITLTVSLLVPNGTEAIKIVEALLFKVMNFIQTALAVIIVDMWSRESHLTSGSRNFWNVVTMFATSFSIMIISAILAMKALWIFLVMIAVCIILSLIYIFRNIENIKID